MILVDDLIEEQLRTIAAKSDELSTLYRLHNIGLLNEDHRDTHEAGFPPLDEQFAGLPKCLLVPCHVDMPAALTSIMLML
jgi:hypothetical protein